MHMCLCVCVRVCVCGHACVRACLVCTNNYFSLTPIVCGRAVTLPTRVLAADVEVSEHVGVHSVCKRACDLIYLTDT